SRVRRPCSAPSPARVGRSAISATCCSASRASLSPKRPEPRRTGGRGRLRPLGEPQGEAAAGSLATQPALERSTVAAENPPGEGACRGVSHGVIVVAQEEEEPGHTEGSETPDLPQAPRRLHPRQVLDGPEIVPSPDHVACRGDHRASAIAEVRPLPEPANTESGEGRRTGERAHRRQRRTARPESAEA